MEISRRFFLGGLLTVSASVAVPLSRQIELPWLHGDGVRDDWAALQAFVDGKPFRTKDGFVGRVMEGKISGGRFMLSKELDLSKLHPGLYIGPCTWAHPDGEDTICDGWRVS